MYFSNPIIRVFGMSPKPNYFFNLDISDDHEFVIERSTDGKLETLVLKNIISDAFCDSIPYPINQNVYVELSNGQHMIFEPALKWFWNTVDDPIYDGGGKIVIATDGVAQCANVPRTFLNENGCKLSNQSSACATYGTIEGSLKLSPATLVKFYGLQGAYIYTIFDLRLEDDYAIESPCTLGERSRWNKIDTCVENVKPATSDLFGSLIRYSRDTNSNLKDIYLEDEGNCHWKDVDKLQLYIQVDGECWMSIHPDAYNIYDFSEWANAHPGNTESDNFIMKPAAQGRHMIKFPSNHPMTRWNINKSKMLYIGRLGDVVEFMDIPIEGLRSRGVAEAFGVYIPKPEGKNILVCGSPGEVSNNKLSTQTFSIAHSARATLSLEGSAQQKKTVWTMIALNAKDQLRQRMAW